MSIHELNKINFDYKPRVSPTRPRASTMCLTKQNIPRNWCSTLQCQVRDVQPVDMSMILRLEGLERKKKLMLPFSFLWEFSSLVFISLLIFS